MKKNNIYGIVIKILIIISSVYGMAVLCVDEGILSLTYFTILSNIFTCVISLLFLIKYFLFKYKKKTAFCSKYIYFSKLLATVSIALTFCVYLLLIAPTCKCGIVNAYLENGAGSLCVHFIAPLLTIIDFLFFDNEYKFNKKDAIYTIISPSIYTILIIIISCFGVRWGNMAVPYNFLNFYSETGWFGFNLALFSNETTGIGVFYSIIFMPIAFFTLGLIFIYIKDKR